MTVLCHAHIDVVADSWNPLPIAPVGSLPLTHGVGFACESHLSREVHSAILAMCCERPVDCVL